MMPPYGLTVQAFPISNYDGDTAKFEFKQEVTIRITDEERTFDTPEICRPKSKEEKWVGELARDAVNKFLNGPVRLYIPAGKLGVLGDSAAVGNRYAGRIWNEDGLELSEYIKQLELTKIHSSVLERLVKVAEFGKSIYYTPNKIKEVIKDNRDGSILYLPGCEYKPDDLSDYQVLFSLIKEKSSICYINSLNKGENFYNYIQNIKNLEGKNVYFVVEKDGIGYLGLY